MISRKDKFRIAAWEAGCVLWIAFAGSLLHFAFELTEYWRPMAVMAAVNESLWEHTKMYFWPGLLYVLVQYTYVRHSANNYWLGKAMALLVTPAVIFTSYYLYMAYATAFDAPRSLAVMLGIMFFGIATGQFLSYRLLTSPQLGGNTLRYAGATYAVLIGLFSSLTFFPPRMALWENYFCYEFTGEYGILEDYEPYRVFVRPEDGSQAIEARVNYCASAASQAAEKTPASASDITARRVSPLPAPGARAF